MECYVSVKLHPHVTPIQNSTHMSLPFKALPTFLSSLLSYLMFVNSSLQREGLAPDKEPGADIGKVPHYEDIGKVPPYEDI